MYSHSESETQIKIAKLMAQPSKTFKKSSKKGIKIIHNIALYNQHAFSFMISVSPKFKHANES